MHTYMVLLATQPWMNSCPLSTLIDSSIVRKIVDKEQEYGEMTNQTALFHMAWWFHTEGQEFGWLSRDGESYVLTRYTNASWIGNRNGHKMSVPPLEQCEAILTGIRVSAFVRAVGVEIAPHSKI